MGRGRNRLRTAAVAVVMGTVLGAGATQGAFADGQPQLSVGWPANQAVDLDAPAPAPLTVTLDAPPAVDAYLRLAIAAGTAKHVDVRVTDANGNELPATQNTATSETVLVGAAPGTQLTAGTQQFGIQAESPTDGSFTVTAQLVNGATGAVISSQGPNQAYALLRSTTGFTEWTPQINGQWQMPGPVLLHGGNRLPVAFSTAVHNQMSRVVTGSRVALVISADALAAAHLTAAGLAAHLKAQGSSVDPSSGPQTTVTWQPQADGSLELVSPAADLPVPPANTSSQTNFTFWITGDAGMPSATLPFTYRVLDTDGRVLTTGPSTTLELVAGAPHDANWDGKSDLMVRATDGQTYVYRGTGNAASPFLSRIVMPNSDGLSSYTGYTVYGSDPRTGMPLEAARCTADHCGGSLMVAGPALPYPGAAVGSLNTYEQGSGWNYYTLQAGAGDITGDGNPDLLSRDNSGVLWISPGTGQPDVPAFHARVEVGSGWNQFTQLAGAGDLTGDGHPDLLARDSSGVLWLYQGTGKASSAFLPRVRIGSGWNQFSELF